MNLKNRLVAASAAGILGLVGLVAVAPAASANSLCSWGSYGHTSAKSWTTGNGQCEQVSARSTMSISNVTVYTGWSYGANYAEAGGSPNVVGGRHGQQPFVNQWIYVNS